MPIGCAANLPEAKCWFFDLWNMKRHQSKSDVLVRWGWVPLVHHLQMLAEVLCVLEEMQIWVNLRVTVCGGSERVTGKQGGGVVA